jgi:TolC family type I secretion outer membrane protein
MKRIISGIFYFVFVLSDHAIAQTLEEALACAYENNNILKARREELKAIDENVMVALANFLPTVQASKQTQDSKYNSTTLPTGNQVALSGITNSLSIQQNIFNGGTDVANIRKAKLQVEAQRAQLVYYEQQILLAAVEAYLGVVRAQMQLEVYEQKVRSLYKYLESVEARFQVGENTKTDVAQAKSSLSNAIASRIKARGDLASAKAKFTSIIMVEPENLTLPGYGLLLPTNVDEAVSVALKKNPQLIVSELQYKAADQGVNAARGDLLPNATLSQTWQSGDVVTQNGLTTTATVISLNVPIFTPANWAQLRSTKKVAQQYKYSSLNSKQDVIDGAIKAWEDYEIAKAAISAQEDAVASAKIAYDGMVEEEKAGTRSTVDVIVAQNQYFDADISLVAIKTNNVIYRYALKSAVGELTAKDLGLKVPLFDPLKNYNKIRWELIGSF